MAAEPVKGSTVAFSDKTIAKALANIYRKRVNVKTEIEPELFLETVHIFNLAAATGISDAVDAGTAMPDDDFLQAIKTNNEVFAAFRTHKMQNDIAAMMTDSDGKLKSFSKFAKDVKPYTDHKNRAWLQTEYNTAVIRAHQAADWQQFEREKDVLPNLEWMPSTSTHPGEDHQPFWGTILPVEDPWWDEHRPGDRWNCKCRLRNTDKEATAVPTGTKNDQPNRGLENNPGKDGKIFSNKHPYMPQSCSACPFGHGKLWALAAGKNRGNDCAGCGILEKVTGKSDVAAKLNKLHSVHGSEYNKTLQEICALKVFKPMPKTKGTYWVENIKDKDLQRLKDAAKKAVEHGNTVYIMPNPGTTKSMDFIFERKGIYKDYDLKTVMGKNSVGNRLDDSEGQSKRVLLNITTKYDGETLAKQIRAYFASNKEALEVLIYNGKQSIRIDRTCVNNKNFIGQFRKKWHK